MARSYVVTGNKAYKRNFYRILAIRNGVEPRPLKYPSTYWYLYQSINNQPGKIQSLKDAMLEMGFTQKELTLLEEAQRRSDKLAFTEKKAFHAVEGFFDDGSGNFVIKKKPDKELAIKLLFGKQYQREKVAIMKPIQKFIQLVEQRIILENEEVYQQQSLHMLYALALIFLTTIIGIFILFYVKKCVINPLLQLVTDAKNITASNYDSKSNIAFDNEVGKLAQCLNKLALNIKTNIHQLEVYASTDELTGINNRRHFFEKLEHEIARVKRHQRSLSLMTIDVDHFKKFNDQYGHLAGDKILKHVCSIFVSEIRINDSIARIGGEEFNLLLPETSLSGAVKIAQRICHNIEGSSLNWENQKLSVTVSIGVTEMQLNEPLENFLKRADKAMYNAKNNGRNQVSFLPID